MLLNQAQAIGEGLRETIAPFCDRIQLAGSIRRQRPVIGDIEIVAIPKTTTVFTNQGLFDGGTSEKRNELYDQWATKGAAFTYFVPPADRRASVTWIKTGVNEIVEWSIKPDAFYWRGYIREADIKLDLFLTTPEKWGVVFTIRTGSAEFSNALVSYARYRVEMPVEKGRIMDAGDPLRTPEERDVFEALGLEYVEPELRNSKYAVKPKRKYAL